MIGFLKDKEKRALLFLGISLISLVVSFFNPGDLPLNAAWAAIVLCGVPIVKTAIVGLVTKFDIKADVLVSIALIASLITGEIFAAGEVAFIMAIGSYLEERTVAKARAGIERLISLTPRMARLVRDGEEITIPAEQLKIGDTVRLLAGETVPADGLITKGKSSIDYSVMTGESLPVDKAEGDDVLSGTVNQFGTFDMVVQKTSKDSSLQRMIRLVEQADAGKAKIVTLTDKWATWIVVIALTSALVTWFVTGEIIRAVTILVVFCPCALVLATPAAIMAGIGNATKYGMLVRRGDALERLSKVKRIAFDKTGTLTYGKPALTKIIPCIPSCSETELLEIAAAVELRSEHPLGQAVTAYYQRVCGNPLPEPENFELVPGRGVYATIHGERIVAGNEAMLKDEGCTLPPSILEKAGMMRAEGSTVIYVATGKDVLGFIVLSDIVRSDAVYTVKAIQNIGIKTILLTGDSDEAARHIARLTGIADIKSHCLPENKLQTIQEYQNRDEPVCMVGDGINDAPALKAACVGIAMGGIGSDIAIEAADIALVSDDIKEIPHLLRLSKRVMRTINVNLTASMALNFAAIVLAIAGVINPIIGALVHNAGSVAVIINSSLLLKWRNTGC
ncbi:MAG: cation-translocating P-type ATPase [Treponema sp.]|jgi:heavy metal translocating P-type ATPase|nr:cation-translocating P-type ATPase [Treponema sp.]